MEVNGLKIEPGAGLFKANLSGTNLTVATMPDGSVQD
jgi:hypothetical protein